jgi:hypothetical protein
LQPFVQTPDSLLLLSKSQHPSVYYTVAPLINGHEGIRANTINYTTQGSDCYIKTFFLQNQTASAAFFIAELGTVFNVAEISFEKLSSNGFVPIQSIPNPPTGQFIFSDPTLKQGENHYRIRVRLNNGSFIYSNVEIVYHVLSGAVLIYPNPVKQNSMMQIISNESGRYHLQIADNNGRIVWQQLLTRAVTQINAGFFAKGLYFATILDKKGRPSTQKFMIY